MKPLLADGMQANVPVRPLRPESADDVVYFQVPTSVGAIRSFQALPPSQKPSMTIPCPLGPINAPVTKPGVSLSPCINRYELGYASAAVNVTSATPYFGTSIRSRPFTDTATASSPWPSYGITLGECDRALNLGRNAY